MDAEQHKRSPHGKRKDAVGSDEQSWISNVPSQKILDSHAE